VRWILIFAGLLLASCGKSAAPIVSVTQQRQAALDRIADRCGAPRNSWKLISQDQITLEQPAYTSDARGSCLINELFKSKLPVKLGFVAEPPAEERK
jgi:hypothetical protein